LVALCCVSFREETHQFVDNGVICVHQGRDAVSLADVVWRGRDLGDQVDEEPLGVLAIPNVCASFGELAEDLCCGRSKVLLGQVTARQFKVVWQVEIQVVHAGSG
jgi:hypothetical protein